MGSELSERQLGIYVTIVLISLSIISVPSFLSARVGSTDYTEFSIEELMNVSVFGASRFDQKAAEIPSFVSIVTADEIKKYGYRTLADILNSLAGFHIIYDRTYNYIGFRGLGNAGDFNARYLVLIDGHRINDNIYDSTYAGNDLPLDIDLIDRVEVMRGPSSVVYGSNAFLGVINVVIRKGEDLDGFEGSASAGSFDTYSGRLSYGKKFSNGFEMLLSASGYNSKGDNLYFKEFDNPATNNGIMRNGDTNRNGSAFAQFSYKDFTLSGAYGSRTKGIPTAPYDTDFTNQNEAIDQRGYVDLTFARELDDVTKVKARAFYDSYTFKGTYPFEGILNKDYAFGRWWGGDVMLTRRVLNRHKISLGAEYTFNAKQDQGNYDENPYVTYLDDNRDSTSWAAYIQGTFYLRDNLIIDGGLRYDHYDFTNSTVSPRLGLIYNLFEETRFKLIYGTSFRTPNVYELYYQDSVWNKANPSLKSETNKNYEIVYEQRLFDRLHFTAAGFYNRITRLIGQTLDPSDGFTVFRNLQSIKIKGLELELEGGWDRYLMGRMSYTYQDAWDKDTGRRLVNSPIHMAKVNVMTPLWKDWVVSGLEMLYSSSRKTLNGRDLGGFFTTNLTLLTNKLIKGLEMSFSVYNLLDRKYSYPASAEYRMNAIEQDGRALRFKVTYGF